MQNRPPLKMRTVTNNDKTPPWSRSNYVLKNTSLPSSDGSNNNFSGTQEE
jgi:hypothetical protein